MTENDECLLWGSALAYWSKKTDPTECYVREFCYAVIKEWNNLQLKTKRHIHFNVLNDFEKYACQHEWKNLLQFLETPTVSLEIFPKIVKNF